MTKLYASRMTPANLATHDMAIEAYNNASDERDRYKRERDALAEALRSALERIETDYPDERDGPLNSPRNPGLIRYTKAQARALLATIKD